MYTESLSYSALKSEVFPYSARFKLCIYLVCIVRMLVCAGAFVRARVCMHLE